MVQPRRRVSYVIPPSSHSVPRLQLPPYGVSRLGSSGPILIAQSAQNDGSDNDTSNNFRHPRHRLGVASLALDTTTHLTGRPAPEGILYSGGRDGMIISWDLGLPMKATDRADDDGTTKMQRRWEVMTGWADDVIDEEIEDGDDQFRSDGDVLGEVLTPNRVRRPSIYRQPRWELDSTSLKPGTHSEFRQCAQAHTDWVNDVLLCNNNQTVISASSDGTVKAWNPHVALSSDPSTIGSHSDYVRCLAYCKEHNWIASGSFDRTIKLWDLTRASNTTPPDPVITLNPPDATAPKSSVYAIAVDPMGHTIASGSPERVIRLWDCRTGRRTAKLVGHTDNIRAILISDDAKYLLTGSADASIKLWSLVSQRCLHTFAHHADSVWSLSSSHPSLETFYSGDRSGLVSRVDVGDASDLFDGECISLVQDNTDPNRVSEGINRILSFDDTLLWTASGNSSIKRWRIPPRRSVRISGESNFDRNVMDSNFLKRHATISGEIASEASSRPSTSQGHKSYLNRAHSVHSLTSDHWRERDVEETLHGIPLESLVKLISPNDPFTPYTTGRSRDPEVATLYSAASVMSVPRTSLSRPATQAVFQYPPQSTLQNSRTEDTVVPANMVRANYEERELAADAIPLCSTPDYVIPGEHGLVRSLVLNDRIHALTVDTSGEVAVWDVIRGVCLGKYPREEVATASHAGSTAGESGDQERSPREALEVVRERIEGEAVVSNWCSADTKSGVLTIHMNERCFDAEVYADQVGFAHDKHFNDDSKLNIGKWVLKNLFYGFIKEEQRVQQANVGHDGVLPPSLGRTQNESPKSNNTHNRTSSLPESRRKAKRPPSSGIVICAPNMVHAVPASAPVTALTRASPLLVPLIPLFPQHKEGSVLPSIPQSPDMADGGTGDNITPLHQRARSGTMDSMSAGQLPKDGDYFSIRARQHSISDGVPNTPDDFSSWNSPGKSEPQTPLTPSGLMGRLKIFGKMGKKAANDPTISPVIGTPAQTADATNNEDIANNMGKTILQALLSTPLTPAPSIEAPLHTLPTNLIVIISEESTPSYRTIYRSNVASTQYETRALEDTMPMWLIECLLLNKTPIPSPQQKLSFILLPWNKDPDVEPLPELLNTTQSKLTASRLLRIKKVVYHVQEKIDRVSPSSRAGSIRSSVENREALATAPAPPAKAEDVYEILCNDVLLPLDSTLAVVRQFIWRQSSELVMYYRRKSPAVKLTLE